MSVPPSKQQSQSAAESIALIAELFPSASQAIQLKKILLGPPAARLFLLHHDEGSILSALGASEYHSAYDPGQLHLKERGEILARDRGSARKLIADLFKSPLNSLSGEILAGMISALDADAAREITSNQPQFLSSVVVAKPSLAASAQLWIAAGDGRRELFESIVRQKNLDSIIVGNIVKALLESNSDSFLRRAFDEWGKDAVFAALNWITSNGGMMSENCRGALTFHVCTVMDWVETTTEKSVQALLVAAHIIAPYSYQIVERDTRIWLPALNELQGRTEDREALYFCTFLLALGLSNAPPEPLVLVGKCFDIVYRAAWNNQLDDSAWWILDPIVPHLRWPNDWDKCERLRRGLISAFVRHGWPPTELCRRIFDPDILDRLPKSAKKVDGGEAFLQRALR